MPMMPPIRLRSLVAALILHGLTLTASTSYGQPLRIGITQEFETMNPIISSMLATRYIGGTVLRPLVLPNADWRWVCALCEKIPSIENGGARLTGKDGSGPLVSDWLIRKDANWGDGKPVTGADVKLAWEIGSASTVSVPAADLYSNITDIQLDPENPKKFQIVHKDLSYNYNRLRIYPVPAHIEGPIWQKTKEKTGAYEKQSAYAVSATNPGLYNGPYVIQTIKLGSHVTLSHNPHWKGPKNNIEQLVVKLLPNTQTLEANLLSGTLDMISPLGFTFDQALAFEKRLKRDPKLAATYEVHYRESLVYEHIDLLNTNPILQDVRVRKALVYSIDRTKLSEALFAGHQPAAISRIHPNDTNYSKNVTLYPYDVAKAKELLSEAGWQEQPSGSRQKAGQPLKLRIMTTAQNKVRELVQVWLQNEWRKVGIDVEIQNEPARVFFGDTMRKLNYGAMAMYAWMSEPEASYWSQFHSSQIPNAKNSWSGQNYMAWSNPEVDTLVGEYLKQLKTTERQQTAERLMQIYTDEVPSIPLYMRSDIVVLPAGFKNLRMTGHNFPETHFAENWNWPKKLDGKPNSPNNP